MGARSLRKLTWKIAASFLVVGLVPALAAGLMLSDALTGELARIENERLEAATERAFRVIDGQQDDLLATVQDYGNWDELYDPATGADPAWLERNVIGWVPSQFDVDLAVVTDREGRPRLGHFPAGMASDALADQPWFRPALEEGKVMGWLAAPGGPMLIAAVAITPTNLERSAFDYAGSPGVIAFGRYVDSTVATEVADMIGAAVEVYGHDGLAGSSTPADAGAPMPEEARTAFEDARAIDAASPGALRRYLPVGGIGGGIAAVVGIERDRGFENLIRRQMISAFIASGAVGLGLAAALAMLLGAGLARPILALTDGVAALASGRPHPVRRTRPRDELGELQNAFVDMAEALDRSHASLARREDELRRANEELRQASEELKRVNRFLVGREGRMADLKEENRRLKGRGGRGA